MAIFRLELKVGESNDKMLLCESILYKYIKRDMTRPEYFSVTNSSVTLRFSAVKTRPKG